MLPSERAEAEALLGEQRRRIEAFAGERGWELVRSTGDLNDLEGIDKLIVTSADRFGGARRLHDWIALLDSRGTDLVCIEQGLDTGARGEVISGLRPLLAGWDAERLRAKGFSPGTVIDVGVAAGTPELYEAFPNAYHVLVEPLVEFERSLERILAEYVGEYHLVAAGAHEGSAELRLDASPALSSFLEPAHQRSGGEPREVPVKTLDALMRERNWSGPFGLKIDAEGFEHHVIEGASELLAQTEFVIAETSVSERFEGSSRVDDFIALMRGHGFAVGDILSAGSGRLGAQADVLFLRGR